MRRLAASMVLVAFSSTSALAQSEVVPPEPSPQAAKPQNTDIPSEGRIAAALDLLKANGAITNFQAMLDAMVPVETQQMKRTAPTLSDEKIAFIEKALRDAVNARQDELMRIQAIEYARHFDEQELHDLAAFYRSPLGQKYIASIPPILQETAPIVRQWMNSVVQQAQQDILQNLSKQPNDKS